MDNKILGAMLTAVIVVVLFAMVPMIGETTDNAWTHTAHAKATGVLTFTDQPVEGDTFNISTDRYEFDMAGDGVAVGNFDINAGGTLPATLGLAKACINANDTAGVAALNTSTTITLEADDYGLAGNTVVTTEDGTKTSFGAATLTGGVDGTQWDPATNSDIPTGYSLWGTVGGITTLVIILSLIAIAITKVVKISDN